MIWEIGDRIWPAAGLGQPGEYLNNRATVLLLSLYGANTMSTDGHNLVTCRRIISTGILPYIMDTLVELHAKSALFSDVA